MCSSDDVIALKGPRCEHCFDVVFENPEKGYSGRWISRPNDGALLHQECYLFLLAKHIHIDVKARSPGVLSLGHKTKYAPNVQTMPGYTSKGNEKGAM